MSSSCQASKGDSHGPSSSITDGNSPWIPVSSTAAHRNAVNSSGAGSTNHHGNRELMKTQADAEGSSDEEVSSLLVKYDSDNRHLCQDDTSVGKNGDNNGCHEDDVLTKMLKATSSDIDCQPSTNPPLTSSPTQSRSDIVYGSRPQDSSLPQMSRPKAQLS